MTEIQCYEDYSNLVFSAVACGLLSEFIMLRKELCIEINNFKFEWNLGKIFTRKSHANLVKGNIKLSEKKIELPNSCI